MAGLESSFPKVLGSTSLYEGIESKESREASRSRSSAETAATESLLIGDWLRRGSFSGIVAEGSFLPPRDLPKSHSSSELMASKAVDGLYDPPTSSLWYLGLGSFAQISSESIRLLCRSISLTFGGGGDHDLSPGSRISRGDHRSGESILSPVDLLGERFPIS